MNAPPPPPLPRFRRPRGATVVLVVLVVVGVALLGGAAWLASRPLSFGWFAYAPLSETTFSPVGAYSPGLSALLAAAGALLLGLAGGFLLGRRSRPEAPTPSPGD
ncbi:hypothetical protein [Cellulosimicrobium sp. NPDC057127]|uniref:hypothetical protein n=1 Tax=Cellulosimicrobium sp. NPDC057127 TaxID=3346026 RepID=UPI00363822D9